MLPPEQRTPFNRSILGRLSSIEKEVQEFDKTINRLVLLLLSLLEERSDTTDEDRERIDNIRKTIDTEN